MFPTRTIFTVALASSMLLAPAATFAQAVVSEFSSDPTTRHGNDPVFFVRGPGAAQFVHDPASPSRFAGDNKGSLAVTYDSLLPTTRLLTTFPGGFTQHDDFVFGAVITIRLDGFAPPTRSDSTRSPSRSSTRRQPATTAPVTSLTSPPTHSIPSRRPISPTSRPSSADPIFHRMSSGRRWAAMPSPTSVSAP